MLKTKIKFTLIEISIRKITVGKFTVVKKDVGKEAFTKFDLFENAVVKNYIFKIKFIEVSENKFLTFYNDVGYINF